jgi:hypothetical protein
LLIAITAIVLFVLRKRKRKFAEFAPQKGNRTSLLGEHNEVRGEYTPVPYVVQPAYSGPSTNVGSEYQYSTAGGSQDPRYTYSVYDPYGGTTSHTTSTSSKAALMQQANRHSQTLFVRHTDAGLEVGNPEPDPQIVELPPEYPASPLPASTATRPEKISAGVWPTATPGAGGSGGQYRQ